MDRSSKSSDIRRTVQRDELVHLQPTALFGPIAVGISNGRVHAPTRIQSKSTWRGSSDIATYRSGQRRSCSRFGCIAVARDGQNAISILVGWDRYRAAPPASVSRARGDWRTLQRSHYPPTSTPGTYCVGPVWALCHTAEADIQPPVGTTKGLTVSRNRPFGETRRMPPHRSPRRADPRLAISSRIQSLMAGPHAGDL